jgi:hypothetical protein
LLDDGPVVLTLATACADDTCQLLIDPLEPLLDSLELAR